ncbi:uncharacterized protein A4U43_C02F12540 [Asparagus officinalis]|uniref:Uncharacterized protein n=1 Tax=Asparagus officinalis TaxID=4686 RepID=A0A5P1FMN0_ASPOF|nr:uncharacterized protein A4U43_C02F12540 [Asparagus officinalis]
MISSDVCMVNRVKGQDAAFQPAKLVWLIQRDFLHKFRSFFIFLSKGKSVQEMVNEALKRVPNYDALHKGEIPSTDSIVEVFNKVILEWCMKLYNQRRDKLHLPVPERLEQAHDEVKIEARKLFDQQHFGRHHAKQSIIRLYQI